MIDVPAVLKYLRPSAKWSLNGDPSTEDDYAAGLEWFSDEAPPAWSDIEAAWPSVQVLRANEQARQHRLTAFRDEADPLFFGWQRGENSEQAWLDKCEEIRQRFPYVTA